jgi:hypothetical protein
MLPTFAYIDGASTSHDHARTAIYIFVCLAIWFAYSRHGKRMMTEHE